MGLIELIRALLRKLLETLGFLPTENKQVQKKIDANKESTQQLNDKKRDLVYKIQKLEESIESTIKRMEKAKGIMRTALEGDLKLSQQKLRDETFRLLDIYNKLGIFNSIINANLVYLDSLDGPTIGDVTGATTKLMYTSLRNDALIAAHDVLIEKTDDQQTATNKLYNGNTEGQSENTSEQNESQTVSSPSDEEVSNIEKKVENPSGNNLNSPIDSQVELKTEQQLE